MDNYVRIADLPDGGQIGLRPWGLWERLPETEDEKQKNNRRVVDEYKMDLEDLLLHLFEKQPRIIRAGHFTAAERRQARVHNYVRDLDRINGVFNICFKGAVLGYVTCRPHKKLVIINSGRYTGKKHYAQALLGRLVHELFPAATITSKNTDESEPRFGYSVFTGPAIPF